MRMLALTLVGFAIVPLSTFAAEPRYSDRWLYTSTNLLVDKNVDELIALIQRASKAGYNGYVLADYKLNILGRMPERYFRNVERLKKAANEAKVEIIPAVFPIGYSSGVLAHDPNLAEGIPVKNAPFLVKGREASLATQPPQVVNGDFEQVKGDKFTGYRFQDDPGVSTFADREVVHHGKISLRMQETKQNCRIFQKVTLRPWSCYRVSCWVKTMDSDGDFKIQVFGAKHRLTFLEGGTKPTQDWAILDVVFNSLDETEVNLYVGVWGGFKGKIWVDDLKVEEVAMVNVLRREACPLTITSVDGKTTYEEGKDFFPIADDKLGTDDFTFRRPGLKVKLTEKTRIKDGETLHVSWYHPVVIHWEQVTCSLVDPKVFEILKDQAKRVNQLFQPKTFFMSHDEIRVAGWCKLAEKSGKTPGQLLADNVKTCTEILKEVNPGARIVVWSDMFDPNHNAQEKYYLVNGSLKDSWKGLSKDVILANWNGGKAAESLKWFNDLGHSQIIAGYYDGDINNFKTWDKAATGMPKVHGFMYTTWRRKFTHLEEYGKAMTGK